MGKKVNIAPDRPRWAVVALMRALSGTLQPLKPRLLQGIGNAAATTLGKTCLHSIMGIVAIGS